MDTQFTDGRFCSSRSDSSRGINSAENGANTGRPRGLKAQPLKMRDAGLPGRPLPYAFLVQQPRREEIDWIRSRILNVATPLASLSLRIRAVDEEGLAVEPGIADSEWDPSWTWEVTTPETRIAAGCDLPWYVQAACDSGFTDFRVRDADGVYHVLALDGCRNAFCGEFTLRSFRVATIRTFAISWASDPRNVDAKGRLQFPSEIDIAGGCGPVSPIDRLQLTAICGDDTVITDPYFGKLRLRISLA